VQLKNSTHNFTPEKTIVELKDVRAQNILTQRFALNLPRRKVMNYFYQKGKKKWGVTDFVLERTCPGDQNTLKATVSESPKIL